MLLAIWINILTFWTIHIILSNSHINFHLRWLPWVTLLLENCWTRVSVIIFPFDGKCPPHNPFMMFIPFLRIPHIKQHSFHVSQSMGFNCSCVLSKKEFYWNIQFLSIMSWCLVTLIPTTIIYTCDVHRTGLILL